MTAFPRVNEFRIKALALHMKNMPSGEPLNFYGFTNASGYPIIFEDMYPPLHAEGTVNFFFFAMMHNFGFWVDDGGKYVSPLYGTCGGKSRVKGSDLLWKILCAAWRRDAECFSPAQLRITSDDDFARIFSDDDGPVPLFNTAKRLALTRDYARWFRTTRMAGQTPSALLSYANEHADPVHVLREILTHPENGLPGFCEDPLGKKAELLLMALVNRPENYLRTNESSSWRPIVDYHDMRLALRLGHVTLPKEWVVENEQRLITSPKREEAIRNATHQADILLMRESGLTRDTIDILKWSARASCPETVAPNCGACLFQSVCAKRITLFQPMRRTTYY